MARIFSWCTVVAVVVLLFVTAEGLRERSTQIDDHKTTNRGVLRFNSKSLEEPTTASSPSLSRSRSNRDRSKQSTNGRHNEGTTVTSLLNSESKLDPNKDSFVRTSGITEKNSVTTTTEATNDSKRTFPGRNVEETKKIEPAVNRRNGRTYSPETNDGTKLRENNQKLATETSNKFSRRANNGRASNADVTGRLENRGPSVFQATTESSRSRTGRKIQTTYSMKDIKNQVPTSRRYNNKRVDSETTTVSLRREGRGRSTTERVERSTRSGRSKLSYRENNSINRRGQDTVLSESESVRVDIPLTVDQTESPLPDTTTPLSAASQRRSDIKESTRPGTRTGSDRSKSRGRSNDSEAAGLSKSSSRRGSSKFNNYATTEASEQVVSPRRNTASRDRTRGSEAKKGAANESRSRSKGRNLENSVKASSSGNLERDTKRKAIGDRRSRVLDVSPRSVEGRGQDTQDTRGKSRSRSRSDTTTPVAADVTTTVAPDTTVVSDVTTSDSEIASTTIRPTTAASITTSPRPTTRPSTTISSTSESSGRGRGRGRGGNQGRKQKEDFFNQGLGFRGRKTVHEGSSSNTVDSRKVTPSKNDSQSHGLAGWTLRRRPAHLNNSEGPTKTIQPSQKDQTNEVIPPNEQSTSTEIVTSVESSTSSARRGSKKVQTTEENSTVDVTTKSYRRGSKTFGPGKTTAVLEESDNYPPDFKARLTQLKNTNTKIPAPKTTSRAPLEEQRESIFGRSSRGNSKAIETDDLEAEASGYIFTDDSLVSNPFTLIYGPGLRRVKRSSAALFAERSRMKLELARRLVKPELNIEENDLDATTASSFSKPTPTTGVPVVDGASKVARYSKQAATLLGRRASSSAESSPEEVSVKASKLSTLRKGLEQSSKVNGRSSGTKKGRIIAERMVTSISVEERAPAEETTRPYVSSTKPSVITSAFAEEGSETTIDTTRIYLAGGRGGKKAKEEDSTPGKGAKVSASTSRRAANSDTITTFKPKKPYVYQPRKKLPNQSTEQDYTTESLKKSYPSLQSSKYNADQQKSQTSQEENIVRETKFGNGVSKPTFRPRYSKRTKQKSFNAKTSDTENAPTTKRPLATSRYSRKKSAAKSISEKLKLGTTEGPVTHAKKLEFRPRTATYRRHSEVSTTLAESTAKVAITPRVPKFHSTLKTTTPVPRSVAQEAQVNLKIANESTAETPGITGSSNGDSGNTNIFNPTRSVFLSGNSTLLEQLRSTVAPLLGSLGNKTPVFSGSYSSVNSANLPPRITPSGQQPRFSARYKGAELFVRKQNNAYQPTVPSITSSSTTPVTPVENSGLAPPIDVSSPGEPKYLTFYQALETVSVKNEQLQGNTNAQQELDSRVLQVDSNATVADGAGDNPNNDTTSPTVEITSPQTPDTIANTIQDSTLTPRLSEDTENSTLAVTTGAPENPSTTEPVSTSTVSPSSTEQVSTATELPSSTEQVSTSTELSSSTEQVSTSTELSFSTEQASTSTELPSSTEQVSTGTELPSSTEQASTSVELPSSTEQVSTSTELSSSTEQVSTSTDSSSTTEQISTNVDLTSTTEQTSTESLPRIADTTTISSTGMEDVQTLSPIDNGSMNRSLEISSTNATSIGTIFAIDTRIELDESTSSTFSNNETQTTEAQSVTSGSTATSTESSTAASTTVSDSPTIITSESPESNTIPLSETDATQTTDISASDAPTTETVSSNLIDVETTTMVPTATIRNRLIDFAQDILSRLQAGYTTTTVSSQDFTTTIAPTTELSNGIPGSSNNNSLESLSQLREETTSNQGDSGTTTLSPVTMDQSSLRMTEEVTTQSAVGSITTSPPSIVSTQEASTQDEINAFTTTTPTTVTTTTTTTTITQDSQTVSSTDSETVGDSSDSSNPQSDVEVTTKSMITSTDDTLLTELMSIAKTLLSEEMNDTESVIPGENLNVTSRVGKLIENEIDRPSLSDDTLGTAQAAESSSVPPDATTESVEPTSTVLAASEFSTFSVDSSQNEIDPTEPTTIVSPESSTDTTTVRTPQNNVPDNEVQILQTETTPLALELLADIVQSTTPSFTTEIGSQVTLSDRADTTSPDTSTPSQTTTTTTESTETTSTPATNFELTTNTSDLSSSNSTTTTESQPASEQITESVTEFASTTLSVTNITSVTPQLVTDTSTNQPEVTTAAPETTPSFVNRIATTPPASSETNAQITTVVPTAELVQRVNIDVATNPATESTTQLTPLSTETTGIETLETTTSSITTTAPLDVNITDDTGSSTNQSSLTSTTESSTMESTTNTPNETTSSPQTTPNLENVTPTVVARFQDTSSATAQRTAGSGIGQTTDTSTSMIPESSTIASSSTESSTSSTPNSTPVTTASSSVETTTATTTTEATTTSTTTGRVPDGETSTPRTTTQSARTDVFTVTPMTETTVPTPVTSVNIEENLVSTEAGTTMSSSESTTIRIDGRQGSLSESTTTTPASIITSESTTTSMRTTPAITMPTTTRPTASPPSQNPTTQYVGRFGASRLTPAPRFSPSSTTKAPLRDYLVYGIYPNKTIVRKRPEDNLIDARNVDSPYVIFGIFPDGRLVRKFPNGTIIPDPPRNPVEVVFSLSTTTTTNRPLPYYNQANQGTYNLYRGPVYNNNGRPEPMRNVQSPGTVDLGLTGNAIVGPNGGGPDNTGPLGTPGSVPSTNEMSNAMVNTRLGTGSVTPIVSTGRPPTDSQGGRIVQDRERDEATRTKEAGGQRSSVYIGQDKFVNYWTDGASTASPTVLSVRINSVATAANEGPSPSVPSFENLLNSQPGGQVTAPPGFPWRDPLDQIFGITTSSPVITASVASNMLDDSSDQGSQILPRPINPYVEVFTPFSSAIGVPGGNVGSIPPPPVTTPGTPSSMSAAFTATSTSTTTTPTTTTTTTMAPTTTTTTTMAPTTTTTTTMVPTTTTTTTTTTTMAPTTTTTTTTSQPVTTAQRANIELQTTTASGTTTVRTPRTTSGSSPQTLLNLQQQNPFGATFDDLAFLNSLLQSNSRGTTQKTLTEVEQLLANKILSLALNNPGPTRAPKAINAENASPNSIFQSSTRSPSEPIVIDLSPSSTAAPASWESPEIQKPTTPKTSSSTPGQATSKPVTTTGAVKNIELSVTSPPVTAKTAFISTTKAPATVKAKSVTTPRPRTTTQAPLGLGGLLFQALLGGNLFGPPTTVKPVKAKPVKIVAKSVNITPKPIRATEKPETTTTTLRTVDVSKIQVNTPNSITQENKLAAVSNSISTTAQPLLNNPNPRLADVATSTYSPEEDALFLAELLRAVQRDGTSKQIPGLPQDDESFLRAILSGQALTTTTPAPTRDINNAALLAALLKAGGIEPPSPSTNIREQLLLASLGQSVTSAPAASPAGKSTTITTRPASATTRPADTTKKTVTPRPTSRPEVRTTTWSPSSTYPPPLFSSFANYGSNDNSGNGALLGATRAFSQFLGAAISGAAQQLQSFVRNGTRIVSEAVGSI